MSLTSVKMSEDVWLTCVTHALSTESEEIMGLLLGDVQVHFFSKFHPVFLGFGLQLCIRFFDILFFEFSLIKLRTLMCDWVFLPGC